MANRNDPLGYDMKCGLDITKDGRSASGAELVSDGMLHRLLVDHLPLVDAPLGYIEYGEDVRKWAGSAVTQEGLDVRAAGLQPILERDERIESATVTAKLTSQPGALVEFELDVSATLRTGEKFSRVLAVSALTVEFLAQGR